MAQRSSGSKGGKGGGKSGGQPSNKPGSKPAPDAQDKEPVAEWTSNHLWQIQPVRDVLLLAAIFGLLVLGYKLSIVTVPLLLALTFAYLFEPLIERLIRGGRMKRQTAVGGVITAVVIVVVVPVTLGLGFGIVQSINAARTLTANVGRVGIVMDYAKGFKDAHPDDATWKINEDSGKLNFEPNGFVVTISEENAQRRITESQAESAYLNAGAPYQWWCRYDMLRRVGLAEAGAEGDEQTLGDGDHDPLLFSAVDLLMSYLERNNETLTDKAVGRGVGAATAAIRTVTSFGVIAFMAFLTAFFFFFISISYGRVLAFLRTLLPDKNKKQYLDLLGQMDAVISGFIRGRITIAFLQSIVFTIAYAAIGVPMALILGPLVAILSIVPYLALVGIPVSIILMFLNSSGEGLRDHWAWILLAPTVVYFMGQSLDDYVWTPRIQGKATGMDTPTILFASIAGGALMGVYGLLLAIPAAACIKILLKELFWPRFKDWSEGKEKDFLPIGRGGE